MTDISNKCGIIRNVGDYQINLIEKKTLRFPNGIDYLLLIDAILVVSVGLGSIWLYYNMNSPPSFIIFLSGLLFIALISAMVVVTRVSSYIVYTHIKPTDYLQTYKNIQNHDEVIRINRDYYISRIIVKTTPEQDQINICKAVKEIEEEIHNNINENIRLQAIADKCK